LFLRIIKRPTGAVFGVSVDDFQIGDIYDLGPQLAALFLTEAWAEPIATARPPAVWTAPPVVRAPVVLVVDDDPQVQHMAERLLTSDGYNVVTAPNGKDGLAKLLEVWPDVVVLDLDMPVMDGWQFRAEQQRLANERLAAIPVIVVTAEDHAVHHAARLRAVSVLKKPFDPERLLHVIRGALRGHESPQLPG